MRLLNEIERQRIAWLPSYAYDSDRHRQKTEYFVYELQIYLGRQLTELEFRKVAWLNGWDDETASVFLAMYLDASGINHWEDR